MARDDESGGRGRGAARLAKAVGHGSSGGHALTRINKAYLDHHQHREPRSLPVDFEEYPKFIRHEDGRPIIAQNAEEEAALRGEDEPSDDKPRLLELAEKNGVTVDKRWGEAKLRKALTAAGVDPEPDLAQ